MKVIKTWMNAWTTSSRIGGAHHIYPCLFGCSDVTDRLGHYIECPRLFTLWKYMHRNLSIHATKRWGLCSPSKSDIMHICCVFQLIMPPLHMSSRTIKFSGLLTSQSNFQLVRSGEHGVVLQKRMMLLLVTSRSALRSILLQT